LDNIAWNSNTPVCITMHLWKYHLCSVLEKKWHNSFLEYRFCELCALLQNTFSWEHMLHRLRSWVCFLTSICFVSAQRMGGFLRWDGRLEHEILPFGAHLHKPCEIGEVLRYPNLPHVTQKPFTNGAVIRQGLNS
jgi:hypothetical protein